MGNFLSNTMTKRHNSGGKLEGIVKRLKHSYEELNTVEDFINHHSSLIEQLPNLHILDEKCRTCPSTISALNEYSQIYDVKIRFEQVIPSETDAIAPFECLLYINGTKFCKAGSTSKKLAKTHVAKKACSILLGHMEKRVHENRTDFQDPSILTNRYKQNKLDEEQAVRTLEKMAQSLPGPFKIPKRPTQVYDLTMPAPMETVDLTLTKTPTKKIPSLMQIVGYLL